MDSNLFDLTLEFWSSYDEKFRPKFPFLSSENDIYVVIGDTTRIIYLLHSSQVSSCDNNMNIYSVVKSKVSDDGEWYQASPSEDDRNMGKSCVNVFASGNELRKKVGGGEFGDQHTREKYYYALMMLIDKRLKH